MPLVTVDEVAQWLGIDLTGDDRSTDLLTRFIGTATSKVESWCRRSFESASAIAEPHLLDGGGSCFLNRIPVTSISLVNLVLADETLQVVPSDEYTINAQTGELRVTGSMPTRDIQVSYVGGDLAVPDQVKEATMHVVSMLWYAKGRDAAASTQSAGNFTKTLGVDHVSGLPVSAETLLLDYRRVLGALV